MKLQLDNEYIIKTLITDYLKPVYPIYRVSYIHSYIDDHNILRSRFLSRLMECRNCDNSENSENYENSEENRCSHGFQNICIHNHTHYIFPSTVTMFNEYKESVKCITDYFNLEDHISIINIKQVA